MAAADTNLQVGFHGRGYSDPWRGCLISRGRDRAAVHARGAKDDRRRSRLGDGGYRVNTFEPNTEQHTNQPIVGQPCLTHIVAALEQPRQPR
jgi:hypothetical protein